MNYYLVLLLSLLALFIVYTPGIISFSFSRIDTVIQITFIPYAQWHSSELDLKGSNWFGAARVLGGKAVKYSQENQSLDDSYDSIDYFIRICGFEFEWIKISEQTKT